MDDDEIHARAMEETGFWGRRGAGCIVYARSTGRFLLSLRSAAVLEGGAWGTWGGAVPEGEFPEETARRELAEETGYAGESRFIFAWDFRDAGTGFVYSNFVAVIEGEFEPELGWETERAAWVEEGEWPSPLHFGLEEFLRAVPAPSLLVQPPKPGPG